MALTAAITTNCLLSLVAVAMCYSTMVATSEKDDIVLEDDGTFCYINQ